MNNKKNQINKWYALHTRSRHEKIVAAGLENKGITVYLPLQKSLRQWSDRVMWVEQPLISGYVFICADTQDLSRAIFTPGVSSIVMFNGQPAAIPDHQIESLKILINSHSVYEISNDSIAIGEKVVVTNGRLKGLTGELLQHRGKHKLLLRMEAVNQVFLVNIDLVAVQKIFQPSLNLALADR